MIYLDNAATSFPKPESVYEGMMKYMRENCANPGRAGHSMAMQSAKDVFEAREIISKFFNINNPLRLIFCKNATEALNMAIKGCLSAGNHVIATCMEHNSVIRPLKRLEKDNIITLTILDGNEFGEIDITQLENAIKPNTKLIACTLSSNVNGIIMPVKEIGEIARNKGILFLVDASQGAGSISVDVEDMNIDLLAFPGHKGLLGPQGIGGLYVREGVAIYPLIEGGTGSSSESLYQPEFLPDMLESGTLNTPGIIGLKYGIQYINDYGLEKLNRYKFSLVEKLYYGMMQLNNIKIYSKCDMNNNSGIIAFNFIDIDSTEVSYVLDKVYGIACRSGLHCAPLAHKTLGTLRSGIIRLSVSCFNREDDIDSVILVLKEISVHLFGN